MKTTVHMHRTAPAPPRAPAPSHRSTFRLGVLVSLFAAIGAVVVSVLTDVPTFAILAIVVIIGFALSWHATGHRDQAPPR
jgi:hypothetical protein